MLRVKVKAALDKGSFRTAAHLSERKLPDFGGKWNSKHIFHELFKPTDL